jgi:hypothetical protein
VPVSSGGGVGAEARRGRLRIGLSVSLGGNRLGRAGRWLGRRASGRQHRAESSSAVLPVEIECKARAHVAKTPIIIDDYPTLGDGEPQTRLQREEMR